jgi:hypothetical protein
MLQVFEVKKRISVLSLLSVPSLFFAFMCYGLVHRWICRGNDGEDEEERRRGKPQQRGFTPP